MTRSHAPNHSKQGSPFLLSVAVGLVLAAAAFVLINATFRPFSVRFTLEGHEGEQRFVIAAREPLFLEYELVMRSEGRDRPPVVVTLNDRPVSAPSAAASYSTERAILALPFDDILDGDNRLRVRIGSADQSSAFEMRGRIHNYYGIAPDFPRAVVVSDEAVAHRRSQISLAVAAGRFVVYIAICVVGVWLLGRIGRAGSMRWTVAQLLAVLPGPLAAVFYGVARPLHLWLWPESFLVVALVPWLLWQLAAWLTARRAVALTVLGPAVVTVVVLEGGLRLFNVVKPTYIFYSDSYERFRGQPGARFFDATLNSGGFNDTEHSLVRPSAISYRVVALGDSFAVGVVPQRDNFLTVLESLLSKSSPVEVVNMGVSGTEPADYLAILVNEGLAYRPDLVLVNVFVGNDLEARAPRWFERSYVTTFVRALWRLGRSNATVTAPSAELSVYDDEAPGTREDLFMEVEVDRAWVFERGSNRVAQSVTRVAGVLREMRDLARRNGADLLLTLIPDEVQINADLRARIMAARDWPLEQFDAAQPNRLLTNALAADGIEVLDLLPVLSEAARTERVYKPLDTHWNRAGNRVAAEAIGRVLADRVSRARQPR